MQTNSLTGPEDIEVTGCHQLAIMQHNFAWNKNHAEFK